MKPPPPGPRKGGGVDIDSGQTTSISLPLDEGVRATAPLPRARNVIPSEVLSKNKTLRDWKPEEEPQAKTPTLPTKPMIN